MATDDNVRDAVAGESQANRKYAVFAEKAAAEGFPNVAKLYRAASEAEAIHARRLLFVLNAVGRTEENLKRSIEGETYEFTTMYPGFVAEAEGERRNEAAIVFTHAMKAEEVHAERYRQALESVREGRDLDAGAIYLCPVCGNIEIGAAPERCPVCGAPRRMFREVE